MWRICLIYSGDQIKKNGISGHVTRMGGRGEVYAGFWWGSLEGKRPSGRFRCMWDYSIKMEFQKVGWGRMNWIDLA